MEVQRAVAQTDRLEVTVDVELTAQSYVSAQTGPGRCFIARHFLLEKILLKKAL